MVPGSKTPFFHTKIAQSTFFTPFLNGVNQFTSRFNPFGRPVTQSQPFFQQFPQQSQTLRPPPPTRAPQGPTANPNFRNSFQTVRFPTQFGVFPGQSQQASPSQRPPFTAFKQFLPSTPVLPTQTAPPPRPITEFNTPFESQPPQPQFSQPQVFNQQSSRFPPDGAVSSSFAINNGPGTQVKSEFSQSFPGSRTPSSPIRGLSENQQPKQTFDIKSHGEKSVNSGIPSSLVGSNPTEGQ